jgi:hypothetical protein
VNVSAHQRAALHGAGKRLVREAEAYLAVVDVFRAEGLEPKWKSENGALSFRPRHGLDGAGELSAAGEGTERRK